MGTNRGKFRATLPLVFQFNCIWCNWILKVNLPGGADAIGIVIISRIYQSSLDFLSSRIYRSPLSFCLCPYISKLFQLSPSARMYQVVSTAWLRISAKCCNLEVRLDTRSSFCVCGRVYRYYSAHKGWKPSVGVCRAIDLRWPQMVLAHHQISAPI